MILLLDTHTLLWFLRDDPQLSETAKELIETPGNQKLVSIASCWEIAIKAGLGKLELAEPSHTLLEREIPRNDGRVRVPAGRRNRYLNRRGAVKTLRWVRRIDNSYCRREVRAERKIKPATELRHFDQPSRVSVRFLAKTGNRELTLGG